MYAKKTYSKKRYTKRSTPQNQTVAAVARKAAQRVINQRLENKLHDYDEAINISDNGYIQHLTTVPVGIDGRQRIGDYITLRKVMLRFAITVANSTVFQSGDAYNDVRLILFRWRKYDTPIVSDILKYPNNVYSPLALYNSDNKSFYEVLWDKTYTVEGILKLSNEHYIIGGGKSHVNLTKTLYGKKLGAKQVQYAKEDETGTNPYNGLYFLAISDSNQATPSPLVEISARVEYEDA